MKKLLLIVLLFISVVANAQKGISYQAVILDPNAIEIPGSNISGQPFVNGSVWVKFTILSGTTSQFEEVQQTRTDAYGLVNLTIGSEASTAFNAMSWDANQKSLQVFVSFNNGASYTKVSDQKLSYAPYALFAETAGKLASTLQITGGGTGATTAVGARSNLGLGNVDNTSDVDKPISAATQAALNLKASTADLLALSATVNTNTASITSNTTEISLKAPIDSPKFTGTVAGITKSMVGLGSVNNTSDATKPVSEAMQAALDLKANATDLLALSATVNTNTASITSSTTEISLKAPIASPTFTGAVSGITKSMVGLGSVDNTSDAAKPVSNATQSALDLKLNANGIAASATKLATARSINGVAFDGSSDITIAADASTLSGTVAIAKGGTGITAAGTTGQVLTVTGSGTLTWTSISGNSTTTNLSKTLNDPFDFVNTSYASGPLDVSIAQNLSNGPDVLVLNTSGIANVAFGINNLYSNTTGSANTSVGYKGLFSNTTGQNNSSFGTYSLYNNSTGNFNSAFGSSALISNTSGNSNSAFGEWAMFNNLTGSGNTGIGSNALYKNTTGSDNTASGRGALLNNISGAQNTGNGRRSLYNNITGSNNTSIGYNALYTNTIGSNNTAIGHTADVATNNLTNATALGFGAVVSADNTIQLGNTSVTNVKTSGTITAGAVTYPNTDGSSGQVLTTNGAGGVTWATNFSNSQFQILTTTQRDALSITSPGYILFNSTTNTLQSSIQSFSNPIFNSIPNTINNLYYYGGFTIRGGPSNYLKTNFNIPNTLSSYLIKYIALNIINISKNGQLDLDILSSDGNTVIYSTSITPVNSGVTYIPITEISIIPGDYVLKISAPVTSTDMAIGLTYTDGDTSKSTFYGLANTNYQFYQLNFGLFADGIGIKWKDISPNW